MEIILLITLLAATPFGAALLTDKPTQKRVAKYVQAHVIEPRAERKRVIPRIVTGVVALEARNRNTGAEEKLAQMWQDAFDWWSLPKPEQSMRDWLKIKQEDAKLRADLTSIKVRGTQMYEDYIQSRNGISVNEAIRGQEIAAKANDQLREMDRKGLQLSWDEKIAKRIDERYGAEAYYNNDMIRLSAQKKMPTFDYIALTSV